MERVERYREIIERVLREYARYKPSYGTVRTECVLDPVNDHYELQYTGWHEHRRIHGSVIHLDIIGGKVWIQHDGTSEPIADELERAGVPREDIVLGFIPENERQYTGYAVA